MHNPLLKHFLLKPQGHSTNKQRMKNWNPSTSTLILRVFLTPNLYTLGGLTWGKLLLTSSILGQCR